MFWLSCEQLEIWLPIVNHYKIIDILTSCSLSAKENTLTTERLTGTKNDSESWLYNFNAYDRPIGVLVALQTDKVPVIGKTTFRELKI